MQAKLYKVILQNINWVGTGSDGTVLFIVHVQRLTDDFYAHYRHFVEGRSQETD
jgi:hypothetical protein